MSTFLSIAWTLAATAGPQEPCLALASDVEAVELGLPFTLRVERTWPAGWIADEWSARALAPLWVELEDGARVEREGSVTETLRYSARAFQLEDVDFARFAFAVRPPDEAAARIVGAAPGGVRVLSALPGGDPGPPELPSSGPTPAPPRGAGPVPWLAAGLLALAWLGWRAGRARARTAPPAHDPWAELERRWARVETRPGATEDERAQVVDELAHVLREALVVRGIAAPGHTAEELRLAARERLDLSGGERRDLAAALEACERARFGGALPDPSSWAALLEGARRAFDGLRRAGPARAEGRA